MATLSATGAAGGVIVTGTGYTVGSTVIVTIDFSATGRRFNEMRSLVADGAGAISATLPVGFVGNTTVRARERGTATVLATSSQVAVT